MKKLHPVMFAGTGSDVGKSIITRHRLRHKIWHLIPMLLPRGWK